MHRKYFYVILILTLLCFLLILFFFLGQKPLKEETPTAVPVDRPQFVTYISGVGIVEPISGNIHISTPSNRIVNKINVSVNDRVKKGEVLFELDNQDLLATLKIKQREYDKTLANLHKLESLPRKEDLVIAEEALNKAHTALNESKEQYDMIINLPNPRAISKEEQNKRTSNYQQAEAELRRAQAQFEMVKSGTWQPELNVAHHEVEQAKADVEAVETEIQRTYIKSPIDGTVLQIKIHEGETSDPSKTALILGNIDQLNLRVSIDPLKVSMLPPNSSAIAFRQGDQSTEFPLKFIHIEPFMVPKKYLTNEIDEKVDTQVFEILYRIANSNSHLLVGEQMDVYIDVEK